MEKKSNSIVREIFPHVERDIADLGLSTLGVVKLIRTKVANDPHAANELREMVVRGKKPVDILGFAKSPRLGS